MLKIVLFIVVLALVIGPMMMLRPNPGQKRKESLRAMARTKGLQFSIRNLPQQADQIEKPAAMPVYFFPPKKQQLDGNWMLLRTHYEHELNFLHQWAWHGEVRASSAELLLMENYLPLLPNSVKAVSGGGQGVSVYWDESGDQKILMDIVSFLEKLRDCE